VKKPINNKEKKSVNKKIGNRDLIRLTEPRVKPLPFSEWDEELQKIWKRGKGVINIQRTLAHQYFLNTMV